MDNFYQFWNKLNGEPYEDGVPPPAEYDIKDMEAGEDSKCELKPLTDKDMVRYSDEDAQADMEAKKAAGFNPCKLGAPMSDEEFHKFYGLDFK